MSFPVYPLSGALALPVRSQLRDEELSKESQESNWFSAPSALRVYGEETSVCVCVCECQVSGLALNVQNVKWSCL